MNVLSFRIKCILVIIFLLLFPGIMWGAKKPGNVRYNSPEEVTARIIEHLKTDDFDDAVKLFHIPPSYSEDAVYDDIEGITSSLKILRSEFGSITQVRFNQSPIQYYNLAVGGGDIDYWQKYPTSFKTDYEVVFGKLGKGYISVEACKISSYWQIHNVSYGLPTNSPNSKDKIADIAKKMILIMEEQAKKNKRNKERPKP